MLITTHSNPIPTQPDHTQHQNQLTTFQQFRRPMIRSCTYPMSSPSTSTASSQSPSTPRLRASSQLTTGQYTCGTHINTLETSRGVEIRERGSRTCGFWETRSLTDEESCGCGAEHRYADVEWSPVSVGCLPQELQEDHCGCESDNMVGREAVQA